MKKPGVGPGVAGVEVAPTMTDDTEGMPEARLSTERDACVAGLEAMLIDVRGFMESADDTPVALVVDSEVSNALAFEKPDEARVDESAPRNPEAVIEGDVPNPFEDAADAVGAFEVMVGYSGV